MIGARTHESRTRNANARVQRGSRGVREIRQGRKESSLCPALHVGAPRKGISQESRAESAPTRSKAEGYGLGFRFPRPCRLVSRFSSLRCPDQFRVSEALADDLAHNHIESIRVVHILPIVEAERLFIQVAEQVIRFDRNVGPVDTSLQEAPEVFHAIGMYIAVHVGYGVVNDLVNKLAIQPS